MKRAVAALLAALLLAGCASHAPEPTQVPKTPGAQPTRPVAAPTVTKEQDASKSGPYDSIAMLTEAAGWATSPAGVFRTVDGANHWTNVSPPGYVPVDSSFAPRWFFLDAQNGWVVGAGSVGADGRVSTPVFYTHDGGKTWAAAALASHDLGRLFFTDAKHGWVVSYGAAGLGQVFVSVFRTVDGGATWTEVAANALPSGGSLNNFPATYSVTGIVAPDESTAWATGYLRDIDTPWLYVTKDGGATWKEVNLSLPEGLIDGPETRPPIFFGKNKGILPVVSRRSQSEACAVFLRSDDGGASWQRAKSLPCAAPVVYDFVDANHGFVTDGKKVYATADAGQTWETIAPNVSLFGVRQIDFVSVEIGWALTNDAVLKTTDGGRTWSPFVVNVDAKATP